MKYKYMDIQEKDISLLKELWEKNREYHEKNSKFFSQEYKGLEFSERMSGLFSSEDTKRKITITKDREDRVVAYCLSIIQKNVGEICTLYVEESHRLYGIGKDLLEFHLAWMKEHDCEDISVNVLAENDNAIKFYQRVGFQKNIVQMKIVEKNKC